MNFSFFKKIGFLGILGPPYCGIGAPIRIGREMLCLPHAGFFLNTLFNTVVILPNPCFPWLNMSSSLRDLVKQILCLYFGYIVILVVASLCLPKPSLPLPTLPPPLPQTSLKAWNILCLLQLLL